jgi:hypothetical protein
MALNKDSLIYSYIFTFTLLLVVMTNMVQYFAVRRPQKADWWGCWGPTVLMTVSTVLLMVSPTKNLVVNICMTSFRANGFDSTIERALDFAYMPVFGEKEMRLYTVIAYGLMFWGTALQVDIAGKFSAVLSAQRLKVSKQSVGGSSNQECGPAG